MTLAFFFIDPMYLVFMAPAFLLMMWAQGRIRSTYSRAMRVDARLSGAAAARYILDRAGLNNVGIEETRGFLSDHYDPRGRVLRLSSQVYHTTTAAAVGIAAHEAGHAIQHAKHYLPLKLRNAAVPAATFGPTAFFILFIAGMLMNSAVLAYAGLAAFGGLLVFQLVNLPVEFDASSRAKVLLTEYNIVDGTGAEAVSSVLAAAAWTYVAGTLQTLLQFAYYALRILTMFGGSNRDD